MAAGFFLLTVHPIMPQIPAGAAPIGAGHALVWPAFVALAYITALPCPEMLQHTRMAASGSCGEVPRPP